MFTASHDRLKRCGDRESSEQRKQGQDRKEIHCICRKPDDGDFMIQCDECDEWYHGKCVHVPPEEGMAMDKYICPLCKMK